jgi:hypothetical protein
VQLQHENQKAGISDVEEKFRAPGAIFQTDLRWCVGSQASQENTGARIAEHGQGLGLPWKKGCEVAALFLA